MKISKTIVPPQSLVTKYIPASYTDAFVCDFTSNEPVTADDIQIAFWSDSPKWVNALFVFRDWLVKPFGIQGGSGRVKTDIENCIRSGGQYKFVSIPDKSANETVLCANDKHLKMYFSVQTQATGSQQKVTVSTIVHFHNWLGNVYFYTIYPFHYLVVKAMLQHIIRKRESNPEK